MSGKKVFIYEKSTAFGPGAERVWSDTPIQEDSQDKIRWQNESLWPAYSANSTPSHLDASSIDPVGPRGTDNRQWKPSASQRAVRYAWKKVHKIAPMLDGDGEHLTEFNLETDFGERNEFYNLYIDLQDLIDSFPNSYGFMRDEFPYDEPDRRGPIGGNPWENAQANPGDPDAIATGAAAILSPKFAKFLQDMYGIVCMPYVNTRTGNPSRIQGPETQPSEQFAAGYFRRYEDHTTTIDGLVDDNPLRTSRDYDYEIPNGIPYARLDKRYNFIIPDYENALHEKIIPNDLTRLTPNIYLLEEARTTRYEMRELRRDYRATGEPALWGAINRMADVGDFVKLSGLIDSDSLLRDYFCSWVGAVDKIVPFDANVPEAFLEHANAVKALLSRQAPDPLQGAPKFNYLFLAPEEATFFSEVAEAAARYPLYNRISFKPLSGIDVEVPSTSRQTPRNADRRRRRRRRQDPSANIAGNKLRDLGLTKHFARFITMMMQRDFDYYSIMTNPLFDVPVSFNSDNPGLKLRSIDILRLILSYDYSYDIHAQRANRRAQDLPVGAQEDYKRFLYLYDSEVANQRYRSLIVLGRGADGHLAEEEFDIAPSREGNELTDGDARSELTAWLRKKIKQKLRTYQQILEGEQAQSEIVLYRIEKSLNGEHVQDFLIPNTDDLGSIFEYFDTQIAPGRPGQYRYTYKIYATYLVVGNEYRRNIWSRETDELNFPLRQAGDRRPYALAPPTAPDNWFRRWYSGMPEHPMVNLEGDVVPQLRGLLNSDSDEYIGGLDVSMDYSGNVEGLAGRDLIRIGLLVNNRPSVRMVETLVYESLEQDTFSNPPLPPNVEFYPLKGDNNKMLVDMSMLVNTSLKEVPVSFNEGDVDLFGRVRRSQIEQRLLTGEDVDSRKVLFSNDDFPSSYEVYRLQEAPASYADFADALHYSKDLRDDDGVPMTTSHVFTDFLVPNVKYYYTFRTKDVHDLVSNPSAVYRVELVDNLGAVYLLTEVYSFAQEKPTYTKDLQQYLKISPSIIQGELNQALSGLVDGNGELVPSAFEKDVVLGPDVEQVWNKKLKFRITSKKTGRKIDINVDFKTKIDTTKRDEYGLGCPPIDPDPPPPPPRPAGDIAGQWMPEGPGPPEVRQEADRDLSDLGPDGLDVQVDVRRIQVPDGMSALDPLPQAPVDHSHQLRQSPQTPDESDTPERPLIDPDPFGQGGNY